MFGKPPQVALCSRQCSRHMSPVSHLWKVRDPWTGVLSELTCACESAVQKSHSGCAQSSRFQSHKCLSVEHARLARVPPPPCMLTAHTPGSL